MLTRAEGWGGSGVAGRAGLDLLRLRQGKHSPTESSGLTGQSVMTLWERRQKKGISNQHLSDKSAGRWRCSALSRPSAMNFVPLIC